MRTADDWITEPPYSNNDDAYAAMNRAQCYCGAIALEVCADPVDAKICHYHVWQSLHGAPFQWAVIFRKADVRFVRGVNKLCFFNAETGRPGHVEMLERYASRTQVPWATYHARKGRLVASLRDRPPDRHERESIRALLDTSRERGLVGDCQLLEGLLARM